MKNQLTTKDIERLENTSFVAAFAGAGDDLSDLDGLGEGRNFLEQDQTILDCILRLPGPHGTIAVCIESESSCGCIECGDTNPIGTITAPTADFTFLDTDGVAEGLLDIVRSG